jgi:hypothetical protein
MSKDASAYDPYRTPDLPVYTDQGRGQTGRPGWLTALCVLCIVIGLLGVLNGLAQLFGTLFAEQMQTAFTPPGGQGIPPELQQVQDRFRDETLAVQEKFYFPNLVAAVFRISIAGCLVYGGIACLGLAATGRQVLIFALGAAVLFELGHGLLQSLISMEMMTAVNAFFESFLQTMPQGNGPPPEVMLNIMKGSFIVGFVFQFAIGLLKIGFYIWGAMFLMRPAIKALFQPPDAFAPAKMMP